MTEEPTGEGTVESHALKAEELAAHLLARVEGETSSFDTNDAQIFLADVEFDAEKFGSQLRFCRRRGVPFPCYTFGNGDPIPIDFGIHLDPFRGLLNRFPYYVYDYFYDNLKFPFAETQFTKESDVRLELVPPKEAKGFFQNRLVQFLTTRFGWQATPGPNLPPPSKGLKFEVITSTRGLRVHYSRVIFFNPNTVFGSPTSPVIDYIKPGNYVFGVAGPSITGTKFSSAEFEIPPRTRAELLEL